MPPETRSEAEETSRAGAADGAERAPQAPVADDEADAPTLDRLGLLRLRQGDAAGALEPLQRASSASDDPLIALHLGIAQHRLGRHAEAAAVFAACRERLPDDPAPPLNLASALLALGRPTEALRCASDACKLAPQLAEAHYTYGMAWLALLEHARAEQAFAAAAKLKPELADAWVNLGVVRYRLGDPYRAKLAMRRALQAAPHHRAATANLAAFMRLTGEAEAAERLLAEHLRRDPAAAEVRLNLVADLLSEERAGEALALLEVEEPVEPRQRAHWRLQKALALLQLRRPAQAQEVMRTLGPPPPDLAPLVHWRETLLALAAADVAGAQAAASRMEAALEAAGPAMTPEHAIMARYDLAKFWSQQNAPDRAFAQWVQGHELLKTFQPFSRDAYRAFVDANVSRLDRARLRDGPRASNTDPTPVFIVGMPRSGTTLAEQILAAHRDVHGAGERSALGQAFATLGGDWESAAAVERIGRLDTPALDGAATRYLAELHTLAPGASRVVDKMPGNFRYLGLASLMSPGARIINCVRDPRDIGLSIFTFRFHGHHGYAHDLGDLGWYIGEHDRLMAHWREACPNPILTLRLDAWVHDFDATLARVLDFLDLPYDPACERFYEGESRVRTVSRAQVRQPVNARGLGRWKGYAGRLEPLIRELEQANALAEWRSPT